MKIPKRKRRRARGAPDYIHRLADLVGPAVFVKKMTEMMERAEEIRARTGHYPQYKELFK